MSIDIVLSELQSRYRVALEPPALELSNSDIERWSGELATSRAALYDSLALRLAHGFYRNELPYSFCDSVLNSIHGLITIADEIRPDLFWSIFLAFDAGEYFHEPSRREDPVAAYTRPLIEQIVRKHGAPPR